MTRAIREALADGEGECLRLLYNYGLWSRGGGCKGLSRGECGETAVIDDESALEIDSVVEKLRQSRPKVYWVFSLSYVLGLKDYEIAKKLRPQLRLRFRTKPRRRNYFEVTPFDHVLRYVNSSAVNYLIHFAERWIIAELRRRYDEL